MYQDPIVRYGCHGAASAIIGRAGKRKIYAAGGVRNRADLMALRHCAAAGVLVASALHEGAITAQDMKDAATSSGPPRERA